jgi:hypothetical protein
MQSNSGLTTRKGVESSTASRKYDNRPILSDSRKFKLVIDRARVDARRNRREISSL